MKGAGAAATIRAGGNIEMLGDYFVEEDEGPYDPTSSLSKELQLYPWPAGYKPRILVFDIKTTPRKFLVSYETTVTSAGGRPNSSEVTNHGGGGHRP